MRGRNNKGLVTYDRKTKKDAFYIYQAYWTDKPMIHVCGERFVDRAPDERDITVYTNCDEVTLYVNGECIGAKKAEDHAVVFKNVALKEGDNAITAKNGEVEGNTITVRPVAEHNFAYDVPEGNQGANWFDDPAAVAARKAMKFPAGYYSIKDKVGTLMANSETAAVLKDAMGKILGGSAFGMMDAKKQTDDNPMSGFYNMMRLTDLMKMAGKNVTAEMKQQINDALIKIKKD